MSVVIETTLGDITVDLYLSERPRACLNFLKLCKLKYYNFNLFHTISRGFIAQTGDPTGSRTGGESIFGVIDGPSKRFFKAENEPRIKHTRPGLISFVGGEDNMIGSQFFLTLGEDLTYLDEKHCVFGEVVEGVDILEAINEVICDKDDRPYQDVRITHTVVLADPCPDPEDLRVPSRSPSPSAARLAGGRIAPDEEVDETSGRSVQEVAEMQAEREAKARATILEMVGDIPDAEMAPPENVLFVCKLNPVTTDDDLEIIFSRFGKIKSCEVIRDRKTGDSLQYAFIEFEGQKSCEDAYFKMGNVLIDDRRIHVDFSQSVSKVKWMGKGRGVTHYDEKGSKRAEANKDVGKGNYKAKNGIKEEDNCRSRDRKENNSPRRENKSSIRDRKSNGSPRRYRESSRSPKREGQSRSIRDRKSNGSPRRYRESSGSPKREGQSSRSSQRSGYSDRHLQSRHSLEHRRRRSPSPVKSKKKSSSPAYKRKSSRSLEDSPRRNNKGSSYRRRSRSNGRSSNRNYPSPSQSKRSSIRTRSKSPNRVENSVSPSSIKKDKRVSSKMSDKVDNEKLINSESIDGNNKEALKVRNEKTGKSKTKVPKASKTKKKKRKSSNSSDESETESEDDRPKRKKYKNKTESSSESSSSSDDSSSSSEEEKVKSKSKKRKSKKKEMKVKKGKKSKRRKRKYSSSSESSSSESSSGSTTSDSSSSTSDSSSDEGKQKKSKTKRTKSTPESD